MLNIVQVVQELERQTSGISRSVSDLVKHLPRSSLKNKTYSLSPQVKDIMNRLYPETTFFDSPRIFPQVPRSSRLSKQLRMEDCDTLHAHGLWSMPTVYSGRAAENTRKSLILSVHGMLSNDALSYSKTKKKLFSQIFQSRAIEAVDCFHATSEREVEEIRQFGIRAPIALIPWGIDIDNADVTQQKPTSNYVLALSRLHPIKNLDQLLLAWSGIEDQNLDWKLIICGPSEDGYRDVLIRISNTLGLKNIDFMDGVYGQEKRNLMANAQLFILPSKSENFGLTVAESLSVGTPPLVSKHAPWQKIVDMQCGWSIDVDSQSIQTALESAMSLSNNQRSKMGQRGIQFIKTEFNWDRIGSDFSKLYHWSCNAGPKPDFIYRD